MALTRSATPVGRAAGEGLRPTIAADIRGETRKALDPLRADPTHRRCYDDFVAGMVYGERSEFFRRTRVERLPLIGRGIAL